MSGCDVPHQLSSTSLRYVAKWQGKDKMCWPFSLSSTVFHWVSQNGCLGHQLLLTNIARMFYSTTGGVLLTIPDPSLTLPLTPLLPPSASLQGAQESTPLVSITPCWSRQIRLWSASDWSSCSSSPCIFLECLEKSPPLRRALSWVPRASGWCPSSLASCSRVLMTCLPATAPTTSSLA